MIKYFVKCHQLVAIVQLSVIEIDLRRHKLLVSAAAVGDHVWRFGDGVQAVFVCQ